MDRVLILVEEPGALEVLDFFLSSHGFAVTSARSIREAVLAASERPPDVVLCDLDGGNARQPVDLARALRALPALDGAPLVALSAAPTAEALRRYDTVLGKPCAPARVAEALRRALRLSRRQARDAS
jgi:CheY-like chemotaxis protein